MIRLIHDSVLRLPQHMPPGPIRAIITDPQFNVSNKRNLNANGQNVYTGYTSHKGPWDNSPPPEGWLKVVTNCLMPGGVLAVFGVFGSLVPVFTALSTIKGMQFQSHILYHKLNPAPSLHRRMYTHANEIILLYSKGPKWYFDYDMAKVLGDGKQLHNVWEAPSVKRIMGRTRKHPWVLERLILPLTREGDWIVDPFCGSGSILETAETLGRNSIGMDIDLAVLSDCYNRYHHYASHALWEVSLA